jgi:hypothetical protein
LAQKSALQQVPARELLPVPEPLPARELLPVPEPLPGQVLLPAPQRLSVSEPLRVPVPALVSACSREQQARLCIPSQ